MGNGIRSLGQHGIPGYQEGDLVEDPEDEPGWLRRLFRRSSQPLQSGFPLQLPLNVRQLMADVTGRQVRERFGMEGLGNLIGSRDITASDLSRREYEALQDAVLRGMGGTLSEGGGSLEYEDYATEGDDQYSDVGGSGESPGFLHKFFDPSYSMKTTIGQGRVVRGDPARGENPEHYYVDDQYNFNEAMQDQVPFFGGEDERGAVDIIGGRVAGQGLAYGLSRGIGEAFGSPEGEGSMARVNLGDLQEAYERYHGEPYADVGPEKEGIFTRLMGGIRGLLGRDDEELVSEMVSAPPVETREGIRRRDDQRIARLKEQLGSPNISPPELDISVFD